MKLTYDSQADADAEGNVIGIELVGVQYCLKLIEQEAGLDIPPVSAEELTAHNSQ